MASNSYFKKKEVANFHLFLLLVYLFDVSCKKSKQIFFMSFFLDADTLLFFNIKPDQIRRWLTCLVKLWTQGWSDLYIQKFCLAQSIFWQTTFIRIVSKNEMDAFQIFKKMKNKRKCKESFCREYNCFPEIDLGQTTKIH